jgi:hypothetical protein
MGAGYKGLRPLEGRPRPEQIRSERDAESGPNLLGRIPLGPRDEDMGWRHYFGTGSPICEGQKRMLTGGKKLLTFSFQKPYARVQLGTAWPI